MPHCASTVMVVDDDPTARRLVSKAFRKSGLLVLEASNGLEALELFKGSHCDIVLLDVVMPGMDGFETCRSLRNMANGGGAVPIVMVTGADDVESISRAYEAGATDFITKPINWLILAQRVRYILRASDTMAELHKSKALLANAQRIAGLGSWVLDTASGRLQCSRETFGIFGLAEEAPVLTCEDLFKHIAVEDRIALQSMLKQAIFVGKPFKLDNGIAPPNAPRRFISQQVEVVANPATPGAVQLIGIVQDISARKQAELFELDRNRVLEMIIRNHSLQEILKEVTQLIKRQKPETGCAVFLLRRGRLQLGASSGLPEELVNAIGSQDLVAGNSCAAAAACYEQTITVADVESSPFWETHQQTALESGIKSGCSVPVFSGLGSVLGIVSLYCSKPSHPSQEDLKLLDAVCKLAAIAIEQRQLSEQLAHQARHDALTGLPNRASLKEFAQQLVAPCAVTEKSAIMFIDLDRFKHVNDSLGHGAGDKLLRQVAERLKECIRSNDILVRMGGDEFLIILNGVEGRDAAERIATRVLELLKNPFALDAREVRIGASIGLSLYPDDGADFEALQRSADIAMYRAKNRGGNQFQFYSPEMNAMLLERLEIENELRKTMERNELELYYQPLFTIDERTVCGVEALLRWNHPVLGRIPPMKFIPIAEESGLIVAIGEWVLREACRQNVVWQHMGYPPFPVSVNISAIELMKPDFIDLITRALEESGLEPRWLQIEITEGVLLDNLDSAAERLNEVRKLGVSVAIDDFGTGYSSMTYLHRLPTDCLKIDRSFVNDLEGSDDLSSRSLALIKAIISLAQNLGLRIIAEGIENQCQETTLRSLGCKIGQGYFFKEPAPASEICKLLKG